MRGVLLLALLSGVARADDDCEKRGRPAYQSGETAYKVGDFAHAAAMFEVAYAICQRPSILFDLAQSNRLLYTTEPRIEHLRRAVFVYQQFLRDSDNEALKAKARGFIDDLNKKIAEIEASIPPLEKTPEAKPAEPATPAPAPAPSSAAVVAAPAPAPARTPVYKRWWLWTAVAAVVVVGVGVGVGVGLTQSSGPTAKTDFGTFRF
jgi:hypothetical protein